MKKWIAKFMAFVMLLGSVQAAFPVLEAQAADSDVSHFGTDDFKWRWLDRLDDSLIVQLDNRKNSNDKNEVLLEFPTNIVNGTTVKAKTVYTLTYHLVDQLQQEVTIELQDDNRAVVKYRLLDFSSGTPVYRSLQTMNDAPKGSTSPVSGWSINWPVGVGTSGFIAPNSSMVVPFTNDAYAPVHTILLPDPTADPLLDPADTYTYSPNGSTVSSYQSFVNGVIGQYETILAPGDPTWDKEIAFRVVKGNGFAFRVNGETIRFKWDGDKFLYSTDQALMDGKIYDFNLQVQDPISGSIFNKTLNITTGYGDKAVHSFPYDSNVLGEVIEPNAVTDPLYPAHDPQLFIAFERPRYWHSAVQTFVYADNSNPLTKYLSANVKLDSRGDVSPPDLYSSGTVTGSNGLSAVYTHGTPPALKGLDPNKQYLMFHILNLEGSMIFNNTVINITDKIDLPDKADVYSRVYADQTTLPPGSVYTYLEYRIVRTDVDAYVIRITPYKEYPGADNPSDPLPVPGLYKAFKHTGSVSVSDSAGEVYYNGGTNPLEIPIGLETGTRYYKLEFFPSSSTKYLESQVFGFKPGPDDTYLDNPKYLEIRRGPDVIRVLESSFGYPEYQDYIKVTFRWFVGNHNTLLKIRSASPGTRYLYYHFLSSDKPYENRVDKKDFLTLALDINKITSASYPGSSDNLGVLGIAQSPDDPPGTVDGKPQLLSERYILENAVGGVVNAYAEVEVLIPTYDKDSSPGVYPRDYVYMPYKGLYYIYNYADYKEPTSSSSSNRITTGNSNEVSLSISGLENQSVPPPVNLRLSNETTSSFAAAWEISNEQAFTYLENILHPKKQTMKYDVNPAVDTDRSMRFYVYLTTDFEQAKLLTSEEPEKFESGGSLDSGMKWVDGHHNKTFDALAETTSDSTVVWDALNEGYTVRIEYFDPQDPFTTEDATKSITSSGYTMSFTNVDENQAYYVVVRTDIEPNEMAWGSGKPGMPDYVGTGSGRHPQAGTRLSEQLFSTSSPVETVTTKPNVIGPDPNDTDPPAPTGLDKENLTGNHVTIFWDRLQSGETSMDLDRIEYEIIRVEGGQLPSNFYNRKDPIGTILDYIKDEQPQLSYRSWRTANSNNAFTGGRRLYELTTAAPNEDQYAVTNTRHMLTDNNLTPNRIYYYYVRTISYHTDDTPPPQGSASPNRYSEWVAVSVTTKPIDSPGNLRVNRALVTNETDKKTKIGLSFDGPVSMSEVTSGKYTYQVSYRSDNDQDFNTPRNLTTSVLKGGTELSETIEGYYVFDFIMDELKPGTMYMFRVRVINNQSGDESNWSNIAEYRTDYDDKDWEDDKRTDDYYDLLQEKLKELLRKPYWRLQDDTRAFIAVYKSQRMDDQLQVNAGGNYILAEGASESDNNIIYVPIAALEKANSAMTGLAVEVKDVTVILPYDAMDKSDTQSMLDIIKRKTDGDISDYFIKISVNLTPEKGTINGNSALTDQIDINIETIGFTMQETRWDMRIEEMHVAYFNDSRNADYWKRLIKDKIDDGTSDADMILFLDELVEEIEEDLIDDVDDDFKEYSKYSYSTDATAKSMIVAAKPKDDGSSVSAYQYAAGNWLAKDVFDYGGRKAFYTVNPGIYIFAGISISLPSDMPGGDIVKNLIIKYGLLELLGQDLNLNSPVTNQAVLGSIARMAGASRTDDPATYLRGKGLIVSSRDLYSAAAQQDIVYLSVGLYGIKTNTNIATVRITNQNLGSNINGLNEQFKQHIKVAYQLGFISGDMQARGQMTTRQFLELLSKVAPKSNL